MDPIETLAAAIAAEPEESAARCALIDALQEERGYTLRGALSVAGKIVNAARNSRDIAKACRMLDEPTGAWATMRNYIHAMALTASHPMVPISVIAGNHFPVIEGDASRCEFADGSPCLNPQAAFAAGVSVTYTPGSRRIVVGAGWIISRRVKPV